jgi:hypothetical protein
MKTLKGFFHGKNGPSLPDFEVKILKKNPNHHILIMSSYR